MAQKKIKQNQTVDLVQGPASSTDNAIARFDSTTGKLVQNSTLTYSDTGVMEETTNDFTLKTINPASTFDSGNITISSGNTTGAGGNSGFVDLHGGDSVNGVGGSVYIYGGNGVTDGDLVFGNPGSVKIQKNGAAVEGTLSMQSITASRTFTYPDASTTLVGHDATQTLTSKTMSGASNTFSAIPLTALTSDTTTALGIGSVNLGHASDTTLARSAAGVLAVEGVAVPTISSTDTLTNKRVTPRVNTTASTTSLTIASDSTDHYTVTALAVGMTINNPSGTPTDGQRLMLRIKDNGTARALTWSGSQFRAVGVTIPTTTVISKTVYIGMVWNSADSKWDIVAVAQEA